MLNRSPASSWPKTALPQLSLVQNLQRLGFKRIIGIDEVGRGALAGPIVVAAVEITVPITGIHDSKLVSKIHRQRIAKQIQAVAAQVSIGSASNEEIDSLGLSQALALAYQRALSTIKADLVLTDNYPLPAFKYCRAIKGDRLFYPTAAASIVAKVYRDQVMNAYHPFYPAYDWHRNVGYGTRAHLDGIKREGRCSLHRLSFIGK